MESFIGNNFFIPELGACFSSSECPLKDTYEPLLKTLCGKLKKTARV